MQVEIGHVDCDPRTLDKRPNFLSHTVITLYDVEIAQPCNIKTPRLLLDVSHISPGYNYAYFPLWNTYYFLGEPTVIDGVRANVDGELDFMTTYADAIKSLSGYLVRTADSEHKNKYLRDTKRPVQANRQLRTYAFNASPFTANYGQDICYVLTVVGGDHSGSN